MVAPSWEGLAEASTAVQRSPAASREGCPRRRGPGLGPASPQARPPSRAPGLPGPPSPPARPLARVRLEREEPRGSAPHSPSSRRVMRLSTFSSPSAILSAPESPPAAGTRASRWWRRWWRRRRLRVLTYESRAVSTPAPTPPGRGPSPHPLPAEQRGRAHTPGETH